MQLRFPSPLGEGRIETAVILSSRDCCPGFPSPLGEGRIETISSQNLAKSIKIDSLHLWVKGGLKLVDFIA